ncbi:hypothetical protein ACBG92_001834 [Aeromonas veronii]
MNSAPMFASHSATDDDLAMMRQSITSLAHNVADCYRAAYGDLFHSEVVAGSVNYVLGVPLDNDAFPKALASAVMAEHTQCDTDVQGMRVAGGILEAMLTPKGGALIPSGIKWVIEVLSEVAAELVEILEEEVETCDDYDDEVDDALANCPGLERLAQRIVECYRPIRGETRPEPLDENRLFDALVQYVRDTYTAGAYDKEGEFVAAQVLRSMLSPTRDGISDIGREILAYLELNHPMLQTIERLAERVAGGLETPARDQRGESK